VTLHTGLGTFRPIEVEDLSKHKMDAEYYRIEEDACKIVNRAKEYGHRICSVGTTTMRAVESSFTAQKLLKPSEGWTNMFIHPPYEFNIMMRWLPIFIYQNQLTDHDLCFCRI
jgi:S-adenosylmethionine:tRNA ribosyltransferase-isomerase